MAPSVINRRGCFVWSQLRWPKHSHNLSVMIRAFSALFLSLILAMTGHSAAVARSAPDAVDQWVLCTGLGTTVIYTDAEGRPTAAPHLCPDCVVSLDAAILPAFTPLPADMGISTLLCMAQSDAVQRLRPMQTPPARGPPFVI